MARFGRLEKAFLLLLLLVLGTWAAEALAGWNLPGAALLRLLCYLAGFLAAFRLLRRSVHTLLWRVRNRMIVLFLFVGFVPLLLVTALVGLAGYVLTGQEAVYMASAELDRRASRLHGIANSLMWSLRAADPARQPELAQSYLERAAEGWPGLEAWIQGRSRAIVFPAGLEMEAPSAALREFRGIARRQGRFYLLAYVTSAAATPAAPAGDESVIIPSPRPPQPAGAAPSGPEVALLAPLADSYLAQLAPGLGRISLLSLRLRRAGDPVGKEVAFKVGEDRYTLAPAPTGSEILTDLPPPVHRFDYPVTWFTLPFRAEPWRPQDAEVRASLQIQTRPSAVFRMLFGQRLELAQGVIIVFIVVGTLFLVVELLSLVIGVSITRTLTKSVHELYVGTQKVNQGDFSHRIAAGGRDQLSELARSFNTMTESIERLIEESKERERLASELQIARDVQAQLFPKAPPEMRSLEILGMCNAARMVSGDYYDFVKLSEDHLALAVGDVAGKGISAALLMASIQSMLRTQLSREQEAGNGECWNYPTAHLVSQLNVQLYHNTAPEKYATFFFGAYDDRHALLTYTNAGHLPPILIRNGEPMRLEVNGMVVGMFPATDYGQSRLQMKAGDLLVAFTDGVTEPENEFAEEFGEPRLLELLSRCWQRSPQEIIDEIVQAVAQWTGRPELQDDMTLLVARRR